VGGGVAVFEFSMTESRHEHVSRRRPWVSVATHCILVVLAYLTAFALRFDSEFTSARAWQFAATLPESFKAGKLVLRELMRDKLPRAVTTRSKEGFDIPTHDWFRSRLKPLLLDTVNERAGRESGLMLDWPAVRQLMDDHFARRINAGYHLWGLLTLFLWSKRWGPASATIAARSATAITN